MSIGQPILKTCHSMCMALSTFQNQMCHPIHSKQKVGQACSILFAVADKITVRQLSELLSQVKDEQSYIVVRERTHRNTAESTNARVKWWSIFQLGVLIGEGIFQVWWLKRFFEVR